MASANPTNKSFLTNNKYEFIFDRAPNLTFFTQSVNIPDLTISAVATTTPFTTIYVPGNIITYEQLIVTFMVDEDMTAWFEIYNWINNVANPETYDKRGTLSLTPGKTNSIKSDAVLLIKTNSNNPNVKFSFKEMFPTSLSGMQLTSTEGQDFLTTTATFQFAYYIAEKI
jgi:hypothetical protein